MSGQYRQATYLPPHRPRPIYTVLGVVTIASAIGAGAYLGAASAGGGADAPEPVTTTVTAPPATTTTTTAVITFTRATDCPPEPSHDW